MRFALVVARNECRADRRRRGRLRYPQRLLQAALGVSRAALVCVLQTMAAPQPNLFTHWSIVAKRSGVCERVSTLALVTTSLTATRDRALVTTSTTTMMTVRCRAAVTHQLVRLATRRAQARRRRHRRRARRRTRRPIMRHACRRSRASCVCCASHRHRRRRARACTTCHQRLHCHCHCPVLHVPTIYRGM